MYLLTAYIAENSAKDVLHALAPFVPPNDIQLFQAVELPQEEEMTSEFEELAKKAADAVRPKPTQPIRKEILSKMLNGHDTFVNQGGDPDPALRNGVGAISKALKSVFPHDQAVRRLAIPKKTFFEDGTYKGTVYLLTPLGKRVREILTDEGAI